MVELVDTLRLERSAFGVQVQFLFLVPQIILIFDSDLLSSQSRSKITNFVIRGSSAVEQVAVNHWVAGSSPALGAIIYLTNTLLQFKHHAHAC